MDYIIYKLIFNMKEKYYGIVEGFFSEPLSPWSANERRDTLSFVSNRAKLLDTYLYCPKDDILVTKKWDVLYPQKLQNELKNVIKHCNDNNMRFFYGLNPMLDDKTDWTVIKEKCIKKLDQIISLGCTNICLLFDDIPLAYDVLGGEVKVMKFYKDFVECINYLYLYYEDKVTDFWLCSPDYIFTKETPLTIALKQLNLNIGIIWSGNDLFVKKITIQDVDRVKKMLFQNVRIIYWSNYPVNDCEQNIGTFNLGGFYPVGANVIKQLSGIMVNPMREVYANLPFYITFSDFIKKPANYNRKKSWISALKKCGLTNGEVNTINYFSAKNVVDGVLTNSDIQKALLFADIESTKNNIKTEVKKRFIESIQPVFDDAALFEIIAKTLNTGRRVSRSIFLKWDWFPTKNYVVRYLPEIVEIVKGRYKVYKKYSSEILPKDIVNLVNYYKKKYKGREALSIEKKDKALIKKNIQEYITFERDLFLKILNDSSISPLVKGRLVLKRKKVNRFTL